MNECKNVSKPRREIYQFLQLLTSFSGEPSRTKKLVLVTKLVLDTHIAVNADPFQSIGNFKALNKIHLLRLPSSPQSEFSNFIKKLLFIFPFSINIYNISHNRSEQFFETKYQYFLDKNLKLRPQCDVGTFVVVLRKPRLLGL